MKHNNMYGIHIFIDFNLGKINFHALKYNFSSKLYAVHWFRFDNSLLSIDGTTGSLFHLHIDNLIDKNNWEVKRR